MRASPILWRRDNPSQALSRAHRDGNGLSELCRFKGNQPQSVPADKSAPRPHRRTFPISPSPSPSFPNFVHAFPSGRIPLQLLRPGQHICCYSNWIKDWSRQRQQQQPVDPFSFSSANPDFSAFSCARICIFRVLRPENQTSFLTKTVK